MYPSMITPYVPKTQARALEEGQAEAQTKVRRRGGKFFGRARRPGERLPSIVTSA